MAEPDRQANLDGVARAVERRISGTFGALREVSAAAAELFGGSAAPAKAEFARLQPLLVGLLEHPGDDTENTDIAGIGFGTVPRGAVPPWMEWWRADGAGAPAHFVAHNLNPRNDNFYDYLHGDWFSSAASSRRPSVFGPYVDTGGTNDYTVTLSVPVIVAGEVAGVAGADLTAGSFERLLLRALGSRAFEVVLTNSRTRVIASNTPHWLTGGLARRAAPLAELTLAGDWGAGETPWHLLATS